MLTRANTHIGARCASVHEAHPHACSHMQTQTHTGVRCASVHEAHPHACSHDHTCKHTQVHDVLGMKLNRIALSPTEAAPAGDADTQ